MIAKHELCKYPDDCHWVCKKKAWFDESIMLEWVKKILKPYLAGTPCFIVPIILLNSFKVHMLGSVVQAIQALSVKVDFIPPGCTGLFQPVDVGFNMLFKVKLRTQYSTWLMYQDPYKPTPASTTGWIIKAEHEVHDEMIHTAWRKTNFSYFPDHPKE